MINLLSISAIVTHKGAAADAGHYIGFVKKSVFEAYRNPDNKPAIGQTGSSTGGKTIADIDAIEGDEDWYKFDDEKVSVFPKEKLSTIDGGGEDASAYVLLYRTKSVN